MKQDSCLLIVSIVFLLIYYGESMNGASGTALDGNRRQGRPIPRISATVPVHFNKIRSDTFSDMFDDDDLFDLSKRLVTDDYGHLRFGKRGEDFDDYGHLRFGRSGREKEVN